MRNWQVAIGIGLLAFAGLAFMPGQAQAHPPGGGGYYGRGGHDVHPHWHRTWTPRGPVYWYGTGPHDFVPHHHTVTPFGVRGHHPTRSGYTESFHPRRSYRPYGGGRYLPAW